MRTKGIEVKLVQGSPEWHEWRKGGVGGSDAAIIKMWHEHPFSSPYQLWQLKMGLIKETEFTGDQKRAVDRGHDLEPVARELFIKATGIHIEPSCFIHPDYPFVRASLDGVNEDHSIIVELKCPLKWEYHKHAVEGKIWDYYYVQIQHQLAVTGADFALFASYFPEAEKEEDRFVICPVVKPKHSFIEDLLVREKNFWQCVVKGIPPTDEYDFSRHHATLGIKGIVQLSGFAEVGKDTTGLVLATELQMRRYAYADALKRAAVECGVVDGRVFTDKVYKSKHRKKLVDFGRGMRSVDPDVWVRGIFNSRSGIYEAATQNGVFITDCRYANEVIAGMKAARDLNLPHRLIWIERPGCKPKGEEGYTTIHLKALADHIIYNDDPVPNLKANEWPISLESAVLYVFGTGIREVKASDFIK
jgi:putative phage-type endonuclease